MSLHCEVQHRYGDGAWPFDTDEASRRAEAVIDSYPIIDVTDLGELYCEHDLVRAMASEITNLRALVRDLVDQPEKTRNTIAELLKRSPHGCSICGSAQCVRTFDERRTCAGPFLRRALGVE